MKHVNSAKDHPRWQTRALTIGHIAPIAISVDVCLSLVLLLLRPIPALAQVGPKRDVHFNYDPASPTGPLHWDDVDIDNDEHYNWGDFGTFEGTDDHKLEIDKNECDSKKRPSPVDLRANTPCTDTHEILTRKVKKEDCGFRDMTFEVAPNTLRATMPYDDGTCLRPTIDLPNGFGAKWLLTWMEVHVRSEHALDGRRYDGEINFIHVGTEGQNDVLGVPSVLLDASGTRDEPRLQRFIDKWQGVADRVRSNCAEKQRRRRLRLLDESDIKRSNNNSVRRMDFRSMLRKYRANVSKEEGFYGDDSDYYGYYPNANQTDFEGDDKLRRLAKDGKVYAEPRSARRKQFPYDMWPTIHFYRYKGSIVYPPCSSIVQWRVFDAPLVISRRQFKQLARLLSSSLDEDTCENTSVASPRGENFRPLQEINAEKQNVTHCTKKDFSYWQYPFDKQ